MALQNCVAMCVYMCIHVCVHVFKGSLRPAKFTPAVVMSVGSLEYSGSEAPANLVCKSVYSGASCEVIWRVAAKFWAQWEAGVPRPRPILLLASPFTHHFSLMSRPLQNVHCLLEFLFLLLVKLVLSWLLVTFQLSPLCKSQLFPSLTVPSASGSKVHWWCKHPHVHW